MRGNSCRFVDHDQLIIVVDDAEVGDRDRFDDRAGFFSQLTSSHASTLKRSDLRAMAPSMLTPPASITSAATLREKPSSLPSATSSRSPARPAGTGTERVCRVTAVLTPARRHVSESRRA